MKIFEFNKEILIILVYIFLSSISSTFLILIINRTIIESSFGKQSFHIILFILTFILLFTFKRLALRKNRIYLENKIATIRAYISDQLIHANLLQIEQLNRIDIYVKMSTDAKKISKASEIMIHISHSVVTIFFCLFYIALISLISFIIISSLISLAIVLKNIHSQSLLSEIDESINSETNLFQIFDHILFGFKELKINEKKNKDLNRQAYLPILEKVEKLRVRVNFNLSMYMTFLESLIFFFLGIVIFVLNMNIHIQIELINIFLFLLPPVYIITSFYPYLNRAIVAIKRLEKLLNDFDKYNYKTGTLEKGLVHVYPIESLSVKDLVFH